MNDKGIGCMLWGLIGLVIIVGLIFAGSAVSAILDGTGTLDRADTQIAVEQANAEARKSEAEAEILRAKADEERAQAEARAAIAQADAERTKAEADYLLHQAAAGAIEQNTRLVRWYAIRGDVRYVMVMLCGWLPLVLITGCVLGVVLVRYAEKRQNTVETQGQSTDHIASVVRRDMQ
jgi:multidrug efflux pump subunit AcrA (membrane-fusion protein)